MKVKNTPEGLVVYSPKTYTTIRFNKKESKRLGANKFPKDTPPEVVHLEISDRCNLNCPYCYVKNKKGRELTTKKWLAIIDKLVNAGVFQITFGGGEPTLRKDLIKLARYAKKQGLTICMTSNGIKIPQFDKKELALFDQINISWHNKEGFTEALIHLKELGIRRGINFCLSKPYKQHLDFIKSVAKRTNAEILFLTYKPTNDDIKNQIPAKEVLRIAKQAHKEGLKVAVDGMTCQTCLASKRFCDIDSEGNLMACSFVREPVGNLAKEPFKEIWARRNRKIKCPYLKGGDNL